MRQRHRWSVSWLSRSGFVMVGVFHACDENAIRSRVKRAKGRVLSIEMEIDRK